MEDILARLRKDPFRLFFPVGIFCLFYGAGLWIRFAFFEKGDFPIQEHANLFLGGYLYFTIMGFLLTAIPRFTQTEFLTRGELFSGILILIFSLTFNLLGKQSFFWSSILIGWLFLMRFGLRRFRRRKQNPPFSFIFVGLGLFSGFLGSLSLFLVNLKIYNFSFFENWGRLLFYDAMVMAFVIGIGSRLIPGILGFTEIVKEQRNLYERPEPFLHIIPREIWILVVLFFLSFLGDFLEYHRLSFILRAFIITFISFRYWRLHEKIKTDRWHGKMLKLSCLFLLLGSWALCIWVDESIHMKHLIYIGSYCLMTLMVSSRVVLAHGKEGLAKEENKIPYLPIGLLVALASLTRATAIWMPDFYIRHLGYAALLLLLAAFIWVYSFLKKIF